MSNERFHIAKATRIYDGEPYCGHSSGGEMMAFSTIEEALLAREELQRCNPVGWNIWDSKTGALIDGFDHFED